MRKDFVVNDKPRIVCIGGGTGLSVILRGLKEYAVDITAIVTITDDGGSSGRLRKDLHMPPPGDIRNVLVALSDTEPLLERLFQFRFSNGQGLKGHSLGNLVIAAMKEITGDFTQAITEMSKVLAVRGKVLPATQQDVELMAEMTDGTYVYGESQIPKAGKKVHRVSLDPTRVEPLQEALEAIRNADAIVLGPGSIYTSILPNLLVKDIAKTIQKARAQKVFVCNVMTQPGESDYFRASDHLRVIYDHVGDGVINTVLLNTKFPPLAVREQYAQKNQEMVLADADQVVNLGYDCITDDFLLEDSFIRHDAKKVCEKVLELIEADMP